MPISEVVSKNICIFAADLVLIQNLQCMKREDFVEESRNFFVSRDKFLFENEKVSFYYRWFVRAYEFQPGWDADIWNTDYTVSILIDQESRHETKKDSFMEYELYTYEMKTRKTRQKFSEDYLSKVFESIDKYKIEPKIKKDRYKKINVILNGGTFAVRFPF